MQPDEHTINTRKLQVEGLATWGIFVVLCERENESWVECTFYNVVGKTLS